MVVLGGASAGLASLLAGSGAGGAAASGRSRQAAGTGNDCYI